MKSYSNLLKLSLCIIIFLAMQKNAMSQPAYTPYATSDSTIYDVMFQLVDNNNVPTYMGVPFITPLAKRVRTLSKDEGGKFYIVEISPNLIYTIGRGRPQGSSSWQRLRLSAVYNPALRMVVSDNSNPILPTNQKAGLRFDYIFRNKHENFPCEPSLNFDPQAFTKKQIPVFYSHSISFHAMHYSNGQTDSVPDETNPRINNYRNGDFSTNYLNLNYTCSRLKLNNQILQLTTGFQWDWGIKNFVLAYSRSQENSYGHFRWISSVQFNSRPRVYSNESYVWSKFDSCSARQTCYNKFVVHKLRLQTELITGNLKDYRTDLAKYYRLGATLIYEVDFLKWRNVSYYIQLFAGRDYLNIRYDDVIFNALIGFSFRISKIFPVYYHGDPSKLQLLDCHSKKVNEFLK